MLVSLAASALHAQEAPRCGGDPYLKSTLLSATRRARIAREFEKIERAEVADMEAIVGKATRDTKVAIGLGAVSAFGVGAAAGVGVMVLGAGSTLLSSGTLSMGGVMGAGTFVMWGKASIGNDNVGTADKAHVTWTQQREINTKNLGGATSPQPTTSRELATSLQAISSKYEMLRSDVYTSSESIRKTMPQGAVINSLTGGYTDLQHLKVFRDEAADLADIYKAEAENLGKGVEELAALCKAIDTQAGRSAAPLSTPNNETPKAHGP